MYRAYFRKNDMEEPPPVDDGDEDKETPAHVIQNSKAEDESNLEARFYRYGVRPEWLQIHRILRNRSETYIEHVCYSVLHYLVMRKGRFYIIFYCQLKVQQQGCFETIKQKSG